MTKNIIEIRKLKKTYRDKTVLRNISFSVQKGSIRGFIGPNGAGKTTTLSCLMGGVKPSAGKIYLGGRKIGEDELVNQKIGFMTEQAQFAEDLRVEDFVRLAGQLRNIPSQKVENRLRQSRQRQSFNVDSRKAESFDANLNASIHAADERILKEV